MQFVYVIMALALLVILISYAKLNTFLSFLIVSLGLGCCLGIGPEVLAKSIQTGMGNTLGSLIGVIVLGSMLGKIIGQSGAAQQISDTIATWVGVKKLRWAFLITGFLVGLPLFYAVGFMLLVPLAITVATKNNVSAVYVGLPLLASLSVTQGYLPPHPAPLYLVHELKADMGTTLMYGILISIPAILISGALYGSLFSKLMTAPNPAVIAPEKPAHELPGKFLSFFTVLLPILLIGASALITPYLGTTSSFRAVLLFLGDANVSLLITILFSFYSLRIFKGRDKAAVNVLMGEGVKEVASIIMIFAGAGALKQVLTDGGITQQIAASLQFANMNLYVLGWLIAAIIRVCVGSSTVAGITTAGFILPLMANGAADANLMVLAIGSGSMMCSHVNDTGFWLFREYFRLSMKDTLKTWTVMDTLVSITGLLGVLVLALFI
jgi:Gnt-I system high-affinity gluconate transporter